MNRPDEPFDEPWQARAFAMAQAVLGNDDAAREDFRRRLAGEIGREPSREYWEAWLAALEGMIDERRSEEQ